MYHRKLADHVKPGQNVKLVMRYDHIMEIVNLLWYFHEQLDRRAEIDTLVKAAATADPVDLKTLVPELYYPLKGYPRDEKKKLHTDIYNMFLNLIESLEYEE